MARQQQQKHEEWTENGRKQGLVPSRDADVRPFSNGTEGYDWRAGNCDRCAKCGSPDDNGDGPCPMETAVARGFIIGTVPAALAAEYGAEIRGAFATMPRQCAAFAPTRCEWVSWPGTRRRQPCDERMVATVEANGYTRGVCARHLKRYAAEHPERAPVLAVESSRSYPNNTEPAADA